MKLLLTTIKTDNKYTEYSMKSLYSIVAAADSPIDVEMKMYEAGTCESDIYEDIVMGQNNIVYLHCDEFNENQISTIVEMVKKAVPDIAIVVGGMQVSADTSRWMKANPWADYVIRGEGEVTLFRFLRSVYNYDFDFDSIPGFAYRNEDQISVNKMELDIEMDDLPFVYEMNEADEDVIYYESMRGNSERAAYEQYIPTENVRTLSFTRVCRELRYFLVKAPKKVVFFDKCFNCDGDRAYKILEYLIKNDNGSTTFVFNISGEKLDDETVRLLSEARKGLFEFNIEVASTNADVLSAVNKSENIYQLMYNVTKLLQAGTVTCNIILIAGLPHETAEMFAKSFNKAYGLCDGSPLNITTLRMAKGTHLRHDAEELGYEYSLRTPFDVISSDAMSATEIIGIKNISRVVKAYIGDGGFKNAIPRVLNDIGLKPYEFFSMLTGYIYSNKFDNKLDSKEELARFLRTFAGELYEKFGDSQKSEILAGVILSDLRNTLSEENVIKFERDGWDIEG